ncbi:MAG TPA: sugar phosphate nucleotidyltransferase [Tepidisphaeraceae bacterium]|jgi:UTP--glucose-1-phosphate uridylyltransferase|nr:sugar phosphate nucleotidyltransferase [Tepidisphaeraceae bacterium]
MKVRKAVITAAARGQHALPLQTLVDRDSVQKSALKIILEEALSTGVETVCIVISPGDQKAYATAAGDLAGRLHFVEQDKPLGYGHALHTAKAYVGSDPFLHLVSDHLYVSRTKARCARQLVQMAEAHACSVSGVQATRENMLTWYGTVGGRRVSGENHLYEVEHVVEKPTPTEAEQTLIVPGLRAGYYLCFFGMHVLTPAVMELLGEEVAAAREGKPVQLSPALARLAAKERYLAMEVQGQRYNIGVRYGLLHAQLALALDGNDREEILTQIVELLALRERAEAQ